MHERNQKKKKNISKEKKEHIEGRISMLLRNKTKNLKKKLIKKKTKIFPI